MSGIDKQAILALIARQPKIRTVEIADHVDCEPDQVEQLLRDEISRGDITKHSIKAPSGKEILEFEFSPKFRQTSEYSKMLASMPAIPVTASAGAAPTDRDITPAEAGTYMQRAIAFLVGQGKPATSAEMRKCLGLGPHQFPSTFLHIGTKNGQLKCSEGLWSLGPAFQARKAEAKKTVTPVSKQKEKTVKPEVNSPTPAPAPSVQPEFACAVWSTGALTIRRGESNLELSPAEVKMLRAHMDRTAVAA
jgi:hypothetical protein